MTDMSKFKVAKSFQHLDPNQGLADGISSGFSSIRYRGKAWNLQHGGNTYPFKRDDDGSPLTYVDIIILGISPGLSKVYFGNQGNWNEDSASGPICASLKGDVPDPGVSIPQAKSCGICSHNEWITKPDGRRGQECQSHKRMAVLLMPAMTKKMLNGVPLLEPVFLKIPPGSLKSLKKYSDELQHQGIPFASVVTRVAFSPDRLFEMTFEINQALGDKEAEVVLPLMSDQQTRAIMGSIPDVRQIAPPPLAEERPDTGLLEAFGNGGAAAAPAPAPAPAPAKSRGRPSKTIEAVKPVEIPVDGPAAAASGDYEESDTDLDDTVAKLMSGKMQNMLK